MKAVIVYQSLWGNTAAVARAIAEGIGPGTPVLTTIDAAGAVMENLDLLVVGAPLIAFSIPSDKMLESIRANPGKAAAPPDLSHISMQSWLKSLPQGHGRVAAYETRIWWSPGSAAKKILRELEQLGYRRLAEAQRFIVKSKTGPLREGEIERARLWGGELAQAITIPAKS